MSFNNSDNISCNELKCRSWGFYGGYDCWAMGPYFGDPFPCAEGYEGVALSSIDPFFLEGVGVFFYYTCCTGILPPEMSQSNFSLSYNVPVFDSNVLPECSVSWDPCGDIGGDCLGDGPYESMVCNDDVYKYPNKNGFTLSYWSWDYSQYQCCQSQINTEQTVNNFLPEVFRLVLGCIGLFFCTSRRL